MDMGFSTAINAEEKDVSDVIIVLVKVVLNAECVGVQGITENVCLAQDLVMELQGLVVAIVMVLVEVNVSAAKEEAIFFVVDAVVIVP